MNNTSQNLELFVQVARNGSFRGASSGEKICNRIALMLEDIGDDVAVIDFELLEGAIDLLRLQRGPWKTYAEKQAVFRLTARAAGR